MCDAYGVPRYWRHYVYGLAWLGREHLREQLQTAQALRLANTRDEFVDWQRDSLFVIQPQAGG